MFPDDFFLELGMYIYHDLPVFDRAGFDTGNPDIVGDFADIVLPVQIIEDPGPGLFDGFHRRHNSFVEKTGRRRSGPVDTKYLPTKKWIRAYILLYHIFPPVTMRKRKIFCRGSFPLNLMQSGKSGFSSRKERDRVTEKPVWFGESAEKFKIGKKHGFLCFLY